MGVRKVGYCMVLLVLTAFLVGVSWNISYADGKGVFASKNCGGCHQIQGPAAEKTFEDQLKKKGPELWYSGSKFKKEWLLEGLGKRLHIKTLKYKSITEKKSKHPPPLSK